MARSLTPDRRRQALAVLAAVVVLLWSAPAAQVVVIAAAALAGARLLRGRVRGSGAHAIDLRVGRRAAVAALALFALLLGGLPAAAAVSDAHALDFADAFYRTGALVFGGGHVVLPLLQARVVAPGWVSPSDFVAGYGAAQAVPGPLFSFAGYLGAVAGPSPNGVAGGVLALVAIFLPGFLLVVGVAPFWGLLRRRPAVTAALAGVNAAVVGLLVAALYHPVFTSAVHAPRDLAVALVAWAALVLAERPAWLVVAGCAVAGQVLL